MSAEHLDEPVLDEPEPNPSRRAFLAGAAGIAGLTAAAALATRAAAQESGEPAPEGEAGTEAAATGRTTSGGTAVAGATDARLAGAAFFLSLGGQDVGFLSGIDGGAVTADVVTEKLGPDLYQRKHIGNVKYEDFKMQMGFSASQPLVDWINASWNKQFARKKGSIIACDFQLEARAVADFRDALITEIGIPACDGASKEAAYLTVKFSPEEIQYKPASSKIGSKGGQKQKQWLPANFRLKIDGLDCSKVSKIEALTIKQSILQEELGEARDIQREPGTVEFPNLVITLAESTGQSWVQWHEDFVIKGMNGDDKERGGTLEFLESNLEDVLLTLDLKNLGIFKVSTEMSQANQNQIKRIKAELYCEQMGLRYDGTLA